MLQNMTNAYSGIASTIDNLTVELGARMPIALQTPRKEFLIDYDQLPPTEGGDVALGLLGCCVIAYAAYHLFRMVDKL